ncbi:MAG: type II CAAX endopeptidase family protein [Novosphingobium sp.]
MGRAKSRAGILVETVAAMLFNQLAPKLVMASVVAAGLTLPDMPLLHRTYLAFASVLVLIGWLRWRGEGMAQFGLVVPRRWLALIGFGIALALAQIVLDSLVRSVTTPLIVAWTGADPHLDAKTFAAIEGNLDLYLMILSCVWLFAAFGEEFLYRGYLMTRLSQLLGGGRAAWALAIIGQAVLFALAHWYQGPVGMVPIGIGAVLTGIATLAWGRNLWPAMIAHGLTDTLGFTLLYLGMPLS